MQPGPPSSGHKPQVNGQLSAIDEAPKLPSHVKPNPKISSQEKPAIPRSSHAGAGGSSPSTSVEVRAVPLGPDTTKSDKQSTDTSPSS